MGTIGFIGGPNSTSGTPGVTFTGETQSRGAENARLKTPDVPRQGGLPKLPGASWIANLGNTLLYGAKVTAIVALTLGATAGCGLADIEEAPVQEPTPIEQVETERPGAFEARGQFIQAPSFDGESQGIWLVPLANKKHFTIDGQTHERLYIGAVGSPEVSGLRPGGFGDVDGHVVVKNDGATDISFVSIDEVVRGLPRDISGVVRLLPAPDAVEGEGPMERVLVLDNPFWMSGALVNDLRLDDHEGSLLSRLQPSDQVNLGARIDAGENGPLAASIKTLTVQRYPGSEILPPTFNGQNFLAGGSTDEVLPEIHLPSQDEHRSQVIVVDAEFGIAHIGQRGLAAGSEIFDGTLNVQAILQGGPALQLDAGAVKLADGTALAQLGSGGAQDTDAPHGWYLHEAAQKLYRVDFEVDAETAAPTSARVTASIDLKTPTSYSPTAGAQ